MRYNDQRITLIIISYITIPWNHFEFKCLIEINPRPITILCLFIIKSIQHTVIVEAIMFDGSQNLTLSILIVITWAGGMANICIRSVMFTVW